MFRPSKGNIYALEIVRKYKLVVNCMDWYYVIYIALLQDMFLLLLFAFVKSLSYDKLILKIKYNFSRRKYYCYDCVCWNRIMSKIFVKECEKCVNYVRNIG